MPDLAMTRQKFLFIHQNFPGQFVHVATELVRLGHEVVALGIKGRAVPGVRYVRYAPEAPARTSEVQAATQKQRASACLGFGGRRLHTHAMAIAADTCCIPPQDARYF
jgi:hypothetical protein